MKRRTFLGLAGAAAAFPRAALGQQGKVSRIAMVSIPLSPIYLQSLHDGLANRGWVVGQNVIIDLVTAPTSADLPAFAARAVATRPDVIVTYGTPASMAVKAATSSIPVVFLNLADPVGAGLVASLAKPGGNLTGTSIVSADLVGKQLAILSEMVPGLRRFAVPGFPADAISALYASQARNAARALGIEPVFVDLVQGQDYAGPLDRMLPANIQGVFSPAYSEFQNFYGVLFDIYERNKIPVVAGSSVNTAEAVPFYGVVHYGANQPALVRMAAARMVADILSGAKPADIPVEEPTLFDIAVNLDTARKIGITIPPSILAQATLVVDEDWRAPKAVAK